MTLLENRPSTALIVLDTQTGVVAEAYGRDAVVANIATLVERARAESVPVIWVQHSDEQLARDSDEWRIVPELSPADDEPRVERHRRVSQGFIPTGRRGRRKHAPNFGDEGGDRLWLTAHWKCSSRRSTTRRRPGWHSKTSGPWTAKVPSS